MKTDPSASLEKTRNTRLNNIMLHLHPLAVPRPHQLTWAMFAWSSLSLTGIWATKNSIKRQLMQEPTLPLSDTFSFNTWKSKFGSLFLWKDKDISVSSEVKWNLSLLPWPKPEASMQHRCGPAWQAMLPADSLCCCIINVKQTESTDTTWESGQISLKFVTK